MKCNAKNFIRRLQNQKEDALEYVIEHYSGFVHAIAFKVLADISKDAVEDCVNDVFLAVWQNAQHFKGEPIDFKKWMGMLTKYKAIDVFRKLEKQQAREHNDKELAQKPDLGDVQEELVKKEQRNELLLAISHLESIDRDIFMMKYYLHLSTMEIAEALHLSKAAVENRLYRGKKKLAKTVQLKEALT
ncbi:sigma-70 family RNA polymerase sigma factor [Lysinibacillus sphaericus]|uniref:RNA polymerase factor sigma-70 n=1 Tax=Lysinibacillus sphaericus OT4b.31 TaxID=1285586 RepID=R7ZHU7_LYSSH|nr:sigma-70 family RNA polymerase sigma factor [Lysinibacillus sphaericus]EON73631.1 RNA polymerase factor sigma-70 [Lysinibacillus sphaericus OT4b.31]